MLRTYSPEVLEYLGKFDTRLLQTSRGRRALTRLDPKLFALVYLLNHVTDEDGHVSFSEVHDDWFTHMLSWVRPVTGPRQWRRAFVAPRSCGKSTMWYLIAPLWAGAHGWAKFIAAFSDTSSQAETHLATFKSELAHNELLRQDYPELTEPARRQRGVTESDNRSLFKSNSGFVFAAKGIDKGLLGLKVGDLRPDVLIGDDLEPSESNYSAREAEKRKSTLVNAVLPLSERARVVLVGTVTMPGSLVHQLVKTLTSSDEAEDWITDEKFECHYYPAIAVNDAGEERSIWPHKWPLEFLRSIQHTRSYAMNYANDPLGRDGQYWCKDDFQYGELDTIARVGLFVDPAITTKEKSDFTGLAVVGYSPTEQKAVVLHAEGVKLIGAPLRAKALQLLERFPSIQRIYVEANQGGDTWHDVFHDIPARVITYTNSESKEVRFAQALDFYQRRRVLHASKIAKLEEQAVVFPKGTHDDVLDAAVAGVLRFLAPPKKVRVSASTSSYV